MTHCTGAASRLRRRLLQASLASALLPLAPLAAQAGSAAGSCPSYTMAPISAALAYCVITGTGLWSGRGAPPPVPPAQHGS